MACSTNTPGAIPSRAEKGKGRKQRRQKPIVWNDSFVFVPFVPNITAARLFFQSIKTIKHK